MKKISFLLLIFHIIFSLTNIGFSSQKGPNVWENWLNEVHMIMTKSEKSVFDTLKTEEDKKRFQASFWKTRDPDPATPQNEYKEEFYNRRRYSDSRLDGSNSDRGRIYILLGTPIEKKNYSGFEDIVDCELWVYRNESRSEIPNNLYLLFFKQKDFGNYIQYYPGVHTSLDILSPNNTRIFSRDQAYRIIRRKYPELAQATLSVIPGEAVVPYELSMSSSNRVIAKIYSLPEREVNKNYLKNYSSIKGVVDVDYSAKEIRGKGIIALSEIKGIKFLNYSILPDKIQLKKTKNSTFSANIRIVLRIENQEGDTIHQHERYVTLESADLNQNALMEKRQVVFRDFIPIIDGLFNISITLSNESTGDFFVFRDDINISDKSIPVLVGFRFELSESHYFEPFRSDHYKVYSDPRHIYNKDDSIVGVIKHDVKPSIQLVNFNDQTETIPVEDITAEDDYFIFKQPLSDIKSGNYFLIIKADDIQIYKNIVSVLSFLVEKPIGYEKNEQAHSLYNYFFILAQQYFNMGEINKSIDYYKRLPQNLINTKTLPVICRAYYANKDYQKVIELLDNEATTKDYSALLLLGNSYLKLNKLDKAAENFENLRKYGDSAKINRTLGAIYFSLGDEEKANAYWKRADNIDSKKLKN